MQPKNGKSSSVTGGGSSGCHVQAGAGSRGESSTQVELHHSAGGLQCTDDQSNAKVTAMQLLLSREVRGTQTILYAVACRSRIKVDADGHLLRVV